MKTNELEQGVNAEEHFSAFESNVLEAAKRQEAEILAAVQKDCEEKLAAARKGLNGDAVAAHKQEIESELRRCLAAAEQNSRKLLLNYRKQLVNGIFAEAREQLMEYVTTDAYKQNLLAICARHQAAAQGQQVTVSLCKRDLVFAEEIEKLFCGCTVKKDKTIAVGGIKIAIGNRLYDETIGTLAEEERKAFLMRCRLHVNPMENTDEVAVAEAAAPLQAPAAEKAAPKAAKKPAAKKAAAPKTEEKPAAQKPAAKKGAEE